MKSIPWKIPVTVDGIAASLEEWTRQSGISKFTVYGRLKRGLSPLEALITPDREGHKLRTAVGLDHLRTPCNPVVQIGTVTKHLKEWSEVATLPFDRVARAVNGGISPIDAFTVWCIEERDFWDRYWEERIQDYVMAHPESPVSPDEALSLNAHYELVQQPDRIDPLEFYSKQLSTSYGTADPSQAAKLYANTARNWGTTISSPDLKAADDQVISLYTAVQPLAKRIQEGLTCLWQEFQNSPGPQSEEARRAFLRQTCRHVFHVLAAHVEGRVESTCPFLAG